MTEDEIKQLSKELVAFTEGLSKFNNKNKTTNRSDDLSQSSNDGQKTANQFDKSTQKIVNALALLSANLAKASATEREKREEFRAFKNSVDNITTAQENYSGMLRRKAAKDQEIEDRRIDAEKAAEKLRVEAAEAAAYAARRSSSALNGRIFDAAEGLKNFGSSVTTSFKESKERLDKFNEALSSPKNAKGEEQTLKDRIALYRDHDNVGKQTFDSLARVGSSADIFSTKLDVLTNGSVAAHGITKVLSVAFEAAKKAVVGYTTAIYNGERGAKVAAKAVTDLVAPLNDLTGTVGNVLMALSLFAPAGIIGKTLKALAFIGGGALQIFSLATKAALKYNELASAQADTLYTSFMDINKSGVVLEGGLTDTFKTMQEFGLSVSEATQFVSQLSGSAKDLKFLGITAGRGAKAFAEVAGSLYKSNLGRELELLGVSQEEQREAALKYMSIQARTGQIQTKNVGDLVKASAEFIKEMDLGAQFAGNSRKEQIEAYEESMTDERFNAAMREAKSNNDKEMLNILEKAQAMAAQFKAAGNETARIGILQQAAARGSLTTDAAIQTESQFGTSRLLLDSSKTAKDVLNFGKQLAETSKLTNKALAGVNSFIGKTSIQTPGQGSENYQDRILAMETALKKSGFQGEMREFLETEQGKRSLKEVDAKLAQQVDTRRAQKSLALTQDKFINQFIETGDKMQAMAETFTSAVNKFDKTVTGGKYSNDIVTGGPSTAMPNLRPNGAVISHKITPEISNTLADVKAAMIKRGETNETFLTAALANVMKESGGINRAEDLKGYAGTDNADIIKKFGERASSLPSAELTRIKADPKLFAGAMYGGEWGKKNLGNIEPSDAWTYRGRGYIQLTGKSNYAAASEAIFGDATLVNDPDLITKDHRVAAQVTAWLFERGKKQLAKPMGISENNMSTRAAAELTTSIVAGGDIRHKRDYIRNDLLNQVEGYASTPAIQNIKPTPPQTTLKKEDPAWLPKPSNGSTGRLSGESVSSLDNTLKEKLISASEEYHQVTGKPLDIESARRTPEKQLAMWNDSIAKGRKGRTAEGRPIAPPGTSTHERGLAVDITDYKNPVAITAMRKNGLVQNVPGDDVHFEQARTGGIFKGPSSGYNVELHGQEQVAVLPKNEGVSKQALNSSIFNQDPTVISDMMSMFTRMNEKYDTMIELLASGNEYTEKLVNATV